MIISNLHLLTGLNELQNSVAHNISEFPNKLCEFIANEFQLQSAILFKINNNNKLVFQGKSPSARKSFLPNALYECSSCKIHQNDFAKVLFNADVNCEIQSTDFVIYESCISIKVSSEKYLLKVSQKTPFTQGDREFLEQFGEFLIPYLQTVSGAVIEPEFNLSKIVAELANEFRTPTNSIIGFSSLLNDDKLTSNQADYVLTIRDNAQKLLSLLNDLIDFARVDGGGVTQTPSEINFKNVVTEILNQQSDKLKNTGFTFVSSIANDLAAIIKIDHQKLRLVLTNFLSYLLYHSVSGEVTVTANLLDKKHVAINISNKTASMPDRSSLPKALDISAQKQYSFTALSYMLARKYVELMQGTVEAASNRDRGTNIRFILPINEVNDIEAKISILPKASEGKNKVLVIEDDYATSKLLANYLNKWGYEPVIVNAGLKALEYLEREQVLAIITDIILPDINGLELLKKIRENKSTKFIPIIVCSVEAEQQKAFLMGAVEYFVKPIKYKDLVEVLTSYKLKKDSNILCVDDDVPTLNLVKEAISSVGYNPIALSQSSKVIETIKDIPLDLAIIDLDMPEINGFDLIKLIKSNPKYTNLPIMIYTGKENYEEDLKKIDGLFTELLDKRSTNIEDLASTVNAMINRYDEPTTPEEAAKQIDVPKILLVEDYKHSQIIVTRLLKKNNFTSVVVVENGAEAVDQVGKQKFDLILMDMQMPVMNGFEATEKIRMMLDYKEIPIIALTAFAMKGDKEKCLESGATDYIPKPIDSQEFVEKVKFYTSDKFIKRA
ncbi:MAG: response regulator [Ignavibacteriaceae bacterium]|nr:response regulator [Ignavibacteriaceae bacterium]